MHNLRSLWILCLYWSSREMVFTAPTVVSENRRGCEKHSRRRSQRNRLLTFSHSWELCVCASTVQNVNASFACAGIIERSFCHMCSIQFFSVHKAVKKTVVCFSMLNLKYKMNQAIKLWKLLWDFRLYHISRLQQRQILPNTQNTYQKWLK